MPTGETVHEGADRSLINADEFIGVNIMKLSREGNLYKLHRFTYGTEPSYSLCPFFWKVLIASALFPFTWISFPFRDADNLILRLITSFLGWIALVAAALLLSLFIEEPRRLIWAGGGVLGVAVAVFLICGVIVLFEEKPWAGHEPEIVAVIRERKDSFKDKYCPRIDWQ